MCWSAPVSLATFLTSIFMCVYLYYRNLPNDRPLALWIAWFALMQLFEFFMWRDMQNHALTAKLSLISVVLQPLVLAAGLYYYYYIKDKRAAAAAAATISWRKPLLQGIILLALLQAASASYFAFVTAAKASWLSTKGPNCHLIWWFKKHEAQVPFLARADIIFNINLFLAVLAIKPFSTALIYMFIGLTTYMFTKQFYPLEDGSLWCWLANILGLVTIVLPYIKF